MLATPGGQSAWLAHLRLLAQLPHPVTVLLPTLLDAVRAGFDARFASFGWAEKQTFRPVAFWAEYFSDEQMRWISQGIDQIMAALPLTQQLQTDGQAVRDFIAQPEFTQSEMYKALFAPLGMRWATTVPLPQCGGANYNGFMYLHRSAASGPFSDQEQARLRCARDALSALCMPHRPAAATCPRLPVTQAVVLIDHEGRFLSRSARFTELSYLCHNARTGVLAWARPDLGALPGTVAALVRQALGDPAAAQPPGDHTPTQCTVPTALGDVTFTVQRLAPLLPHNPPQVMVQLNHLEPLDVTLARQLLHWPLSPQQKRLVVALAGEPSLTELAVTLGVTPGSAKMYTNRLLKSLNLPSRQAVIDTLLAQARKERGLATMNAPGGPTPMK